MEDIGTLETLQNCLKNLKNVTFIIIVHIFLKSEITKWYTSFKISLFALSIDLKHKSLLNLIFNEIKSESKSCLLMQVLLPSPPVIANIKRREPAAC